MIAGAPHPVPMFSPGVKVAPSRRGTNKKSGRATTAHGRRRGDEHTSGGGRGDGGGQGGGDGKGVGKGEEEGGGGGGGVTCESGRVNAPSYRATASAAKPPTSEPTAAANVDGGSGSDDVPSMPAAQRKGGAGTPPNSRAQHQQKSDFTASRSPTFANSPYFKRGVNVETTPAETVKASVLPPNQYDDNEDEWETDEHSDDHDATDDTHIDTTRSVAATAAQGTRTFFNARRTLLT